MNQNLKIAILASIEAGREIMKVYSSDFSYQLKNDDSPLTIADKKANTIINRYLLKTKIPIISEENAQIDYEERKYWNSCWIVDPLDGTKEFIKRNGEFTVNIALVKNGIPALGVVYVPDLKKLYFADVLKKEAYVLHVLPEKISANTIIKKATKIISRRENKTALKVVGSRSHMNTETTEFLNTLREKYKEIQVVPIGSSLKFCLVAEGLADIYPRFAPTMEWDTAAAHAICKALGISVVSEKTKKELVYNKENLVNPWFIVNYEFILMAV